MNVDVAEELQVSAYFYFADVADSSFSSAAALHQHFHLVLRVFVADAVVGGADVAADAAVAASGSWTPFVVLHNAAVSAGFEH